MAASSKFVIHNWSSAPLHLNVEPEAVRVTLQEDEEVTVHDPFIKKPVTLRVTRTDDGDAIISIWPGDGEVVVKKNGVDVLDLVETNGVNAVHPCESGTARSERL